MEFDPPSPPLAATEQPIESNDEILAGPRGIRRSRLIAGTALGVALIAGAVAVGWTESSASASPAALVAAAASSSAPDAGHARPTGPPARGVYKPGQPILFGSVKSVSGATIRVTDQQGFTRTVVTSSKTTYKDGATASPAVGTKIIAIGSVDANGTSLDAATITLLPATGAGAGGRHPGPRDLAPGGHGFGRPTGSHHPGGPAQSDSPSTAPTPAPTTSSK
jgi:hypothetical protein